MVWKKNAISDTIWLIYTCLAGGCFVLWLGNVILPSLGLNGGLPLILAAILLLLLGMGTLGLHRLFQNREERTQGVDPFLIAEGILAIGLLAAGVLLRVRDLPGAETSSAYMEAARVAEGLAIPQLVHGIEYLYLQLLHLVFLLFGNKLIAGIWLQIVLQLVTGVCLYGVVRRLVGSMASLTVGAFWMLSPFIRGEILVLSSRNLFLFLFTIGLLVISLCLGGRRRRPWGCLIAGILAAVLIYLDILGVALAVMGLWMLFSKREAHGRWWYRIWCSLPLYILGLLLGGVASFGVDAYVTGKHPVNIILAWWQLFMPGDFGLVIPTWTQQGVVECMVLLTVMSVGIFSFWFNRGEESLSIWVVAAFSIYALQCFGMVTTELDGSMLFYLMGAICAGVELWEIARPEGAEPEPGTEEMPVPERTQRVPVKAAVEPEKILAESVEAQGEPEIIYIENPLPLPKKHVKRIMDYAVPISEEDDFDIAISEDDDFDY